MKEQLTELLNTLYEAEGLVEMALRRKVNSPDRITRLAIEKCLLAGQLAAEFPLPEEKDDAGADDNEKLPLYGYSYAESAEEDEAQKAEEPRTEDIIEEKEVEVFTEEILPDIKEHFAEKTDIYDASIFEEPEESDAIDESDATEEVSESVEREHKTETAVARNHPERKPLIRSFSINDKFRFRRELFGGDDARFRETLEFLQHLENTEAARSYCFNELKLDSENSEAKDFIQILERYYRQ